MKEVLYKFSNRGVYTTEDSTAFEDERQMKLIAEPHNFSLSLSGEILRKTSFPGCSVLVSCDGEAVFYDPADNVLGQAEKEGSSYREARLSWQQNAVSVVFGRIRYIDNYPNCDGEHDRWDEVWQPQRTVTLNLQDGTVTVR